MFFQDILEMSRKRLEYVLKMYDQDEYKLVLTKTS